MIKNAFAYITRKSLKSIIIMLVILAMSTLSLISLSIKDATDRASKETFANITNSFSMEINRQVNPGTPRGGGNVKGEDIKKIAQTDSIDSYVKRINSVADLVDYDIIETNNKISNMDKIFDVKFDLNKENSNGLGLYIVSNILNNYNMEYKALQNEEFFIFKIKIFS